LNNPLILSDVSQNLLRYQIEQIGAVYHGLMIGK
jgi:hypothetical protein